MTHFSHMRLTLIYVLIYLSSNKRILKFYLQLFSLDIEASAGPLVVLLCQCCIGELHATLCTVVQLCHFTIPT